MPRSGGDSDKLGNRYEGWWTVHNLIDVLAGDAFALQPEAYEDTIGVEFVKTLRNGTDEFHSVKRQRAGAGWTLQALTRLDEGGRSVLKDLFDKLDDSTPRIVVFVSTTIHSQAYEIWDRSQRCKTPEELKLQLQTDKALDEDFAKYVLPLCNNDVALALKRFHALRLTSQSEFELRRQVETNIRRLLYRPDGQEVDSLEVVLKLVDFICNSLGRRLFESDVRSELVKHGYHIRDWAREANVLAQVRALNRRYLRHVESDLILGHSIPRLEALAVAKSLLQNDGKTAQLIVGAAGSGKSSVLAQIVRAIETAAIPYLAIRLDNIPVVTSTRSLGQALDLPDSPAIVLAGLSQGKRAILIIDQLDAMSVVSGRNPDLWQTFEELLQELTQHPNLRLLIACRAFDLEHDPRLARLTKKDGLAQSIKLDLLSVETVKSVVRQGGGDPERLSVGEIEILRTPFHLYLFLHGEPANPVSFGGRQELFARFWNSKRQKAGRQNIDFERVVGLLADELSLSESISAPASRLDLVAEGASALASDNVLILENGRYRFFHESFFDYAFARQFVRERRNLVHFLIHECAEQHLFRRAQVRQVLAYQREDNWTEYLAALSELLNHQGIRLHLKKLALDWLAQLDKPTEEEWQVVEPLLKHPQLQWAAFNLLWGKLSWFDLLNKLGVLSHLLSDDDVNFVNRCVHALSLQEFLKRRSPEVAALLRPYQGKDDIWIQRFKNIVSFGNIHYSQEMFDLVLEWVDGGIFDTGDNLRWHSLMEMTEQRPEFAVKLLGRLLERAILQAKNQGQPNLLILYEPIAQIEPRFIMATAQHAPSQFAEVIIPIIKRLVLANAKPAKRGDYYDEIWRSIHFGLEHDTAGAILAAAREALHVFSRDNPKGCEILLDGWIKLPHKTLQFLLTCAWLGNPTYFAEIAAHHFIEYPLALTISYDAGIGEVDKKAGAWPLLEAISPILSTETHAKIENIICGYVAWYEKSESQNQGYYELKLWKLLNRERIGTKAKKRMAELEGKFPETKLTRSQKRQAEIDKRGGFVPPPIPQVAFAKMKDEQIIDALRKYSSPESRGWEIFSPLQNAAKKDRKRFSALVLKLPNDISANHFEAILWGLIDDSREVVKGGPDGKTDIEIPNDPLLPTFELLKIVQRVHELPDKPCGRAICRVADAIAKRSIPPEFVHIVAFYAINDPNPATEMWNEKAPSGQRYYGGDPLTSGINSTRGSAADSFSRFLFSHPETTDELLPYIEALAKDKSIAVRAVNIQGIMALLNTRKDRAVEIFLNTCQSVEELWATRPVEDFLYYATFSHYEILRPLLKQMLTSEQKHSRLAASRQITLAAFSHADAEADMSLVLNGDEECRKGTAEIYAHNVFNESVRNKCIAGLERFFNDPSKTVRDFAATWFYKRNGIWLDWHRALLSKYIESEVFADGDMICQMNLKDTAGKLPEETTRLVQRAVELFEQGLKTQAQNLARFSYYASGIALRFYEQSKDERIRKTCLDLLDRMIGYGWGEAPAELAKADRW